MYVRSISLHKHVSMCYACLYAMCGARSTSGVESSQGVNNTGTHTHIYTRRSIKTKALEAPPQEIKMPSEPTHNTETTSQTRTRTIHTVTRLNTAQNMTVTRLNTAQNMTVTRQDS